MTKKKIMTAIAILCGVVAVAMIFCPVYQIKQIGDVTGKALTFDMGEFKILHWLPWLLLAAGVALSAIYFLIEMDFCAGLAGFCFGFGGVLAALSFILVPVISIMEILPEPMEIFADGEFWSHIFQTYVIGWGAIVALVCGFLASRFIKSAKKA